MTALSNLGPRLAVGGTAELFGWQGNRVLKLYWEGASAEAVEREAERTRLARAAGAPAPEVFDIVNVDERPGIVFERVEGPLLLDLLAQAPERAEALAAQLAQLQARIHRCSGAGLPSLREHVLRRVHLSALPARIKPEVLDALSDLADDDRLCHGDLHPGNVVVTGDTLRPIDWFDAAAGTPAADLARTCVLLQYARLNSGTQTAAIAPVRQRFLEAFLDAYRRAMPEVAAGLADWFAPVAAARMAEPILAQERNTLLRVVDTLMTTA